MTSHYGDIWWHKLREHLVISNKEFFIAHTHGKIEQEFSEFIRAGIMLWTQSKNAEFGIQDPFYKDESKF